ncbi:ATP-binding cassette domain-containing protein [Aminipila butyrica]|uniref:ATP-binding cassette domain-containing protein n=1 Tax=Aminipila butyrica TaxID=433296 RepID=A0A858BUG2_9FIRM|nr:ATP-binding cassette domain-containing protein [Aminipila butyrica]QIB69217.1 ATP-binding cassette domain-containing protein [Aminipila butyrica]
MRLSAEEISFGYQAGKTVLENISFHIDSGEVVGLAGASGLGKSTLSKILAGYETPQQGRVLLDGKPIPARGFQPVQLVFQHPEKAVDPRWKMKKVLAESGQFPESELLEAMGIQPEWLERWPAELSGGELQRFCVLRALSEKTKFLIADEMTAMLDAITQAQIWHTVLNYVREHQMGLVVISHEQELLDKLCNRVVQLA